MAKCLMGLLAEAEAGVEAEALSDGDALTDAAGGAAELAAALEALGDAVVAGCAQAVTAKIITSATKTTKTIRTFFFIAFLLKETLIFNRLFDQ
jgi:hypothetical protein